jgi:nucleoside-diphosphate-sugar epimerase
MRFLVTGGAGFIGSNIVEELLKRNHTVRVLDNLSTGKEENLTDFLGRIEFIQGDVRNYGQVRSALDGIEVVLHQAALSSVPRSISDPISSNDVNAGGTLNVLKAAKDAGVRRVIYASSSSVYGDTPELPKHEGMVPNPLSPYAVSKLTAELYCRVFPRIYGLETVALRYFNVFGPRQDPLSQYSAVIPKFITAMLKDQQPIVFGDGEHSRDFTFVANVVQGNLLAATAVCEPGSVMNCACHGRITLNELIREINSLLGKNLKPIYREPRTGDIKHSFASIEKARTMIGYSPTVDFRRGLEMTVKWYNER